MNYCHISLDNHPNLSAIFKVFLHKVFCLQTFLYLCNRFGEKSGLMKAFAIISRSAKSLGNLLEITTHRNNM